MTQAFYHDVLIIGSGAAGLSLALRLAPFCQVAVLCKHQFDEGSTYYAQGGIAAVLDPNDSIDAHVADTLEVGAGLSDPFIARFTAEQAKNCVEWLIEQGVAFTKEDHQTHYHLTREAGHSHRRVIHAADATGRVLQTSLGAKVRAHPNIHIFEHCTAIDLIMQEDVCEGADVLIDDHTLAHFQARCTVLATGGASRVYLHTTNSDVSHGDGIAMAWRAGCRVANMEFNQFHPTCLHVPSARAFLITEAMRGEGAYLLSKEGHRFMLEIDPRAELAPRDIVARAIVQEMKHSATECVYLDISHKPRQFIMHHFPTIYAHCLNLGIDITQSPIPIVPAAHYTCGGVMTDQYGRTDKKNLYAIGETAFTGLHGANRMASNSLLECLVFAKSASESIAAALPQIGMPKTITTCKRQAIHEPQNITERTFALRKLMWEHAGIIRNTHDLLQAKQHIDNWQQLLLQQHSKTIFTQDYLALRNMMLVAQLIVQSALMRHESRGLHYNVDYPEQLPAKNTVCS